MIRLLQTTIFALAVGLGVASAEEAEIEGLEGYSRTGNVTSCVNLRAIRSIDAINESQFVVRISRSRVYLNETNGSCSQASRPSTRLQYETSLSQLCRNDIIQIVDNTNGFIVGSCGLGGFELLERAEDDTEAAEDTDR